MVFPMGDDYDKYDNYGEDYDEDSWDWDEESEWYSYINIYI